MEARPLISRAEYYVLEIISRSLNSCSSVCISITDFERALLNNLTIIYRNKSGFKIHFGGELLFPTLRGSASQRYWRSHWTGQNFRSIKCISYAGIHKKVESASGLPTASVAEKWRFSGKTEKNYPRFCRKFKKINFIELLGNLFLIGSNSKTPEFSNRTWLASGVPCVTPLAAPKTDSRLFQTWQIKKTNFLFFSICQADFVTLIVPA